MKSLIARFRSYLKIGKNRAIVALVVLGLVFLRFDLVFLRLPHQFEEGESMWGYLDARVFHDPAITRLGLTHLAKNYPDIDWNHVEANEQGGGGYTAKINFNRLSLIGPNDIALVDKAWLLPIRALKNHGLQVLSYDLVVVAILTFVYLILLEHGFSISAKGFAQIGFQFLVAGVLIPLVILVALLGTFFMKARLSGNPPGLSVVEFKEISPGISPRVESLE